MTDTLDGYTLAKIPLGVFLDAEDPEPVIVAALGRKALIGMCRYDEGTGLHDNRPRYVALIRHSGSWYGLDFDQDHQADMFWNAQVYRPLIAMQAFELPHAGPCATEYDLLDALVRKDEDPDFTDLGEDGINEWRSGYLMTLLLDAVDAKTSDGLSAYLALGQSEMAQRLRKLREHLAV